ncbi:hypothetical protein L3Y34_007246 [Caenorhabditis briggsae]|uniref:Uncharacterized protein n=1 Tax=Caenorhabditis briggsae TaxID=6238 RepID=A0AAE9A3I6_CAEBR|nr:hypothetical protein L3Y34_007246 [Caenorhabditis briggsae]
MAMETGDPVTPTEGFQRLARLLEAENQKFSVISYRIGVWDSVTAHRQKKTKRKKNNQDQLLDWMVV